MSKISEIVKVRSGYTNFVHIRDAKPNDKKFYLLSGSYGTGKSHLCLMLANLLGKSSGDPGLKGFYENYEKLDKKQATHLRNIRKNGQFLVAVCDFGSGRTFQDEVLHAVVEACTARGIDLGASTEFGEAGRLLDRWEKETGGVVNHFENFGKALGKVAPGTTVAALRKRLKKLDREAMERFLEAYRLAQGTDFKPDAGNMVAIVRDLLKSKEFKEKFLGLAIFYDEFGTAVLENNRFDAAVMQAFMEDICQHESNVMFVGCIHKSFKDYAERTNQATASVMEARITQVPLANEGIEEIIGAIVETDKESEIWKKEVQPKTGVFDQLTPHCVSLDLFPWIEDTKRIRQRVLEDIYGIHPMALHCLLELSSEIGSDVRSTFSFFAGGGAPGSYADFIANNEITASNGALRLYQAHQLFDFFQKELSPSNRDLLETHRKAINGYAESIQILTKASGAELFSEPDDERLALLKTILLYELCGKPATLENIQFGLYCLSGSEKTAVKKQLAALEKAGAVYLRKTTKTYELCASEGQDPITLVDQIADAPETHEKATIPELLKQAGFEEKFLVANQWNLAFGEDKRLKRVFVRGRELGPDLWERLEAGERKDAPKFGASYEGHAVYAICEDEGELHLARDAVKDLPEGHIVVAVPNEPTPFAENLRRVLACRHLCSGDEAQKHAAQTVARIRDMLDNDYFPLIKNVVNRIADGSQARWFGGGGELLVENPPQSFKAADMLCERLFVRRCQIKHPDLNQAHDEKWLKKSNVSLKQAVDELLEFDSPIQIDNGNPANHGEKRYLEKVLLKGCGALSKLRTVGTVTEFAAESNPDKIGDAFPVLKTLIERLAGLGPGKTLSLAGFVREMRNPPFGAGGTMLVLAIAHAVRAFGERLRVFADSTKTLPGNLASYADIVAAVADPACKIELAVREISPAQREFVTAAAYAAGAPPLAHGETRTVKQARNALAKWWTGLPQVAKIPGLYPAKKRDRIKELRQLFAEPGLDVFDFMLSRLPAIYAGEPVDAFTEEQARQWAEDFAADVKLFNSGYALAQRKLAKAVLSVFGGSGDMVECIKSVNKWFGGLPSYQRDPMRCSDHADAQALLTVLADSSIGLDAKLTRTLPEKWGFGSLEHWTSLQTEPYKAKWEQAKSTIEEIAPLVPEPQIEPNEHATAIRPDVLEIEEGAKIRVAVPDGAESVVYVMDDDSGKAEQHTVQETAEIPLELGDRAAGQISIYATDESGNTSPRKTLKITNKKKQYVVQIEQGDLFAQKGTFKFPDSMEAYLEVVRSLTEKAREKGVITGETAAAVVSTLGSLKQ